MHIPSKWLAPIFPPAFVLQFWLPVSFLFLMLFGSPANALEIRKDFTWDKVSVQCKNASTVDIDFNKGIYGIPVAPRTSSRDCQVTIVWALKPNQRNTDYGRALMQRIHQRQKIKTIIPCRLRIVCPGCRPSVWLIM